MPRFSRISWKRREDAEPPRIESRIDAAKRRWSERAIPGAPMQTWYCSVSFRAKRNPGGGALTSGRLTRGPPAGCRDDDVPARVHLPVICGEDAARDG